MRLDHSHSKWFDIELILIPTIFNSSLFLALILFFFSHLAQMVKSLSAVWKTRVRSPGWEDSLEKGMRTHSSILAWKIPWTEEPGRLTVHGVARSWTRLSDFTLFLPALVFTDHFVRFCFISTLRVSIFLLLRSFLVVAPGFLIYIFNKLEFAFK